MTNDDTVGRDPKAMYESFLRGERPDDVLVYLHESDVGSVSTLLEIGTRADGGVVLVLSGQRGRRAFERATGLDAMSFAGTAMKRTGEIERDCTDGVCPDADEKTEANHRVRFIFAFAEAQNDEVGGLYAAGDVVHAYAACACGTTYSDKWVVGS